MDDDVNEKKMHHHRRMPLCKQRSCERVKATNMHRMEVKTENFFKTLEDRWQQKPLHGPNLLCTQEDDEDQSKTHQRLQNSKLKAKTEGYILAAQDWSLCAITIKNGLGLKCRVWNVRNTTIDHVVSGCSILAPAENKLEGVGQYFHYSLCKNLSVKHLRSWYEYQSKSVVEWDFTVYTNHKINVD